MTGKGSNPRPMSVSRDVYRDNWEATFGRKATTTQLARADAVRAMNNGMDALAERYDPVDAPSRRAAR